MQAGMPPSRSGTAGRKVCSFLVWVALWHGMLRHGLSWLTMASS